MLGRGGGRGRGSTFMTGCAKYLALQSHSPVCMVALMKFRCPPGSSPSSAVCQ